MPKNPNIILTTDAYKQTHWLQYPPGTTRVYSYLESRGGQFENTLFFGLQYLLKEYFCGQVVHPWMLTEAEEFDKELFFTDAYFNKAGWKKLLNKYGGILPLRIKALPEGMIVPTHNALITVEQTVDDPDLAFLTNLIESHLLQVWYPTTVATLSYEIKKLIQSYAEKTGTICNPFHLNDFGLRGASSLETAAIGGAGHLVNFLGTDNLPAMQLLKKYYHAKACGHSVYASEHSTTTIYGLDFEEDAFRHFLKTAPDDAIVSIVVDSKDTIHAVGEILGNKLKDLILNRKGKVVVRPDSGNPVEMSVQCLQILENRFGVTENAQGFKVLNPRVGVIYGDGIEYDSINSILENVVANKFCVSNIVFGMGGALLQKVNRDTQRFAFKCAWANVNGKGREVFKQPTTDKTKNSKRGRMKVVRQDFGVLTTVPETTPGKDELVTVFENGELLRSWTLEEVTSRQ